MSYTTLTFIFLSMKVGGRSKDPANPLGMELEDKVTSRGKVRVKGHE
jgi:hypothetical protein